MSKSIKLKLKINEDDKIEINDVVDCLSTTFSELEKACRFCKENDIKKIVDYLKENGYDIEIGEF